MNQKLTEIAYILDRSGSMAGMSEAAIESFNQLLMEQQQAAGEARLSLILFDHEYQVVWRSCPVEEVVPLDRTRYSARGATALLDAIGKTINDLGARLRNTPEEERPGQVMVAIYTDGYENASREFTLARIKEMITLQQDVYSWQFLFLAADPRAMESAASMGIDLRTAAMVDSGAEGQIRAARTASKVISEFRERSIESFDSGRDYLACYRLSDEYGDLGLDEDL